MTDLTQDRGTTYPPAHYEDFGFTGVVAHKKLKPTDPTFRFLKWERSDDGSSIMTGAPTRVMTKGEHKGRPKFNGPKKVVVVTSSEELDAAREYEAETGHCSKCIGSGKISAGWNRQNGAFYRTCPKCGGTGKCQP